MMALVGEIEIFTFLFEARQTQIQGEQKLR